MIHTLDGVDYERIEINTPYFDWQEGDYFLLVDSIGRIEAIKGSMVTTEWVAGWAKRRKTGTRSTDHYVLIVYAAAKVKPLNII